MNFYRTGRRRSAKSLSLKGSQKIPAPNLTGINRYFSFAVVSRQRKRINFLCVLRASNEVGGEIILLQYLSKIKPNMSK